MKYMLNTSWSQLNTIYLEVVISLLKTYLKIFVLNIILEYIILGYIFIRRSRGQFLISRQERLSGIAKDDRFQTREFGRTDTTW